MQKGRGTGADGPGAMGTRTKPVCDSHSHRFRTRIPQEGEATAKSRHYSRLAGVTSFHAAAIFGAALHWDVLRHFTHRVSVVASPSSKGALVG